MNDKDELIDELSKLEITFLEINKLNFKAHTYVPLSLNKSKSQELLVHNKRMKLRLRYLKNKKNKIINKLMSNFELSDYIFNKINKIKNVTSSSSHSNKRKNKKRTINNLKIIMSEIQVENSTESIVLVRQCLAYLFTINHSLNNYDIANFDNPYDNKEFNIDLMELNYLSIYFNNDNEIKSYVKFLVYKYSGKIISDINFFDARKLMENKNNLGFSAFAYYFKINNKYFCYISFKGTEGSLEDPRIKSFNKRLNNYIQEGFLDWSYNIDAILTGNVSKDNQLKYARIFVNKILKQVNSDTIIYGLGHSLGGHFVQTLQLLDSPFNYGYTLNSAPIQLKEIKKYKPDLFDKHTWDELSALTYYNTQNIRTDILIKNTLDKDFNEIKNEWFIEDLTRIYFGFPYTFYIGTSKYLSYKDLYYPFKSNISNYLTESDIQLYIDFFTKLIKYLTEGKKNRGSQIIFNTFKYSILTIKEIYNVIKTDKSKKVFKDFATYLYDSKIFKYSPIVVQETFKRDVSKPITAIRVLKGEWPFLSSLNNEMIDTIVYFHTLDGAKYFK